MINGVKIRLKEYPTWNNLNKQIVMWLLTQELSLAITLEGITWMNWKTILLKQTTKQHLWMKALAKG